MSLGDQLKKLEAHLALIEIKRIRTQEEIQHLKDSEQSKTTVLVYAASSYMDVKLELSYDLICWLSYGTAFHDSSRIVRMTGCFNTV